ncbi:MAG TPA: hypothetical protein PKA03_12820 [Tabrizicola sp.]|nr:hypothetical protein [Tabrizicola sp.]
MPRPLPDLSAYAPLLIDGCLYQAVPTALLESLVIWLEAGK